MLTPETILKKRGEVLQLWIDRVDKELHKLVESNETVVSFPSTIRDQALYKISEHYQALGWTVKVTIQDNGRNGTDKYLTFTL